MEQMCEILLGAARFSAQHVWTALLPGLGICLAIGLLLRFTRFFNAATRYVVCWTALLSVILLPGLLPISALLGSEIATHWADLYAERTNSAVSERLIPEESPQLAGAAGQTANGDQSMHGVEASPMVTESDENQLAGLVVVNSPESNGKPRHLTIDPRTSIPPAGEMQPEKPVLASPQGTEVDNETSNGWADILPGLIPPLFLLVWSIGAALLLVQLLRSWIRSRSLIARAIPASADIMARSSLWQERLGCTRPIDVRVSPEIGSPAAVGFKRGTVLLPARLMGQLTAQEQDAVLLHEIVHLFRRDDRARLFEQVLVRLFFVNPLVHWLVRQLDLQREIACDDWVLYLTNQPDRYARALARVVELQDTSHALALAPGMLLSKKQIFSRFEMILDKRRSLNTGLARRTLTAAVMGMAALIIALSQVAPVVAVPGLQIDIAEIFNPGDEPAGAFETEAENEELWAAAPHEGEGLLALAARSGPDPHERPPAILRSGDGTPGAVVVAPRPRGNGRGSYSYSYAPRSYFSYNDELMIALKGRIHLTDDYSGVEDISKKGFLEVIDDRKEPSRRLLIERGDDGLTYLYRIDGRRFDFDDDGRDWLEGLLATAGRAVEKASKNSSGAVELYGSPDGRKWSEGYLSGSYGDALYSLPSLPSVPSVPSVPGVWSVPDVPAVTDLRGLPDYLEALESYELPEAELEEAMEAVRESRVAYAEALAGMGSSFGVGRTMITNDNGRHIVFTDHRGRISVEYDGEIEIADDDRGISAISHGGYFEVEDRRGVRRRLLIESDSDGELDYIYYERRREADFDDDAKEWFGEILLEVIRNTGIGAESRVKRIRKQSGVDGVLEEVEKIDSDYVKRRYYTVLLDSGPLSANELRGVLRAAGAELDSDYEKAELLIASTEYIKEPKDMADAYAEAVSTLDSDYETRRVLTAILFADDDQLDPEVVEQVLEIADDLDSDYERAELLIDLAPHLTSSEAQLDLYIEAVAGLDSDFETRRVLRAMGLKRELTPEQARVILDLASRMDSDFEKAELLIEYAHVTGDDPELLELYLEAAASLDSDYETRRTLSEIAFSRDMEQDNLARVIRLAERMDSDYEKAELLLSVADEAIASGPLREAYLDCSLSLSSDYERGRVLGELIHRGNDDPKFLRKLLFAIDDMSSDHERANLLRELAESVAEHEELEDDYLDVVEGISSEWERDKLYRQFYRTKRSDR